jgi:SAM-dependent methyltransferase
VAACARCASAATPRSGARLDPEGAHLAALRRVADLAGARVLEVGCGDGRLTVGVARQAASVVAFDPDAAAIERARLRLPGDLAGRVSFLTASATDLAVEPCVYDVVLFSWSLCCMEVGVHLAVVRRFREALVPRGLVLDLQVIRPHPRVEADGRCLCQIDATPLFERADAARAAVDQLIGERLLVEEVVDDHDVLLLYESGAALVDDWAPRERRLPPPAVPALRAHPGACLVRERCRLRRLRRAESPRSWTSAGIATARLPSYSASSGR